MGKPRKIIFARFIFRRIKSIKFMILGPSGNTAIRILLGITGG